MRQIKFRVWDKDSKEMYYPTTDLHIDWDKYFGSKLLCEIATENGSRACSDTEYEIMQFTGLKDKNGVEVYEGDILRGFQKEQNDKEGKNGFQITDTVCWRGGGFNVFGKHMQSGYTKDNNHLRQFMWCNTGHFNTPDSYYQIDDIEIIGNIHQNKELLKG